MRKFARLMSVSVRLCLLCLVPMAASVYTEMNAISKGVSLGIYEPGTQKHKGTDASRTGSQPYVELMGRRSVSVRSLRPLFAPTG